MKSNQVALLRRMIVMLLILLGIQYELGMAVNLSPDLPTLPPFGFSLARIFDALRLAGSSAVAHGLLGSLLVLLAVLTLVLSLASRVRSAQIFGSLGCLSIVLAATGGVLFVLSGFQADHFSLAMASNSILAFTFYFLELYFLKPASNTRKD